MPMATPEDQRAYQREWRARRRASFFTGKSCVKCGSTDALQLDHIDPALKVDHKIWSWRQERRAVELAKCQVLCHPCHNAKTQAQKPPRIRKGHGTASMYRRGCKCGMCRLWRRNRYREKKKGRAPEMATAG